MIFWTRSSRKRHVETEECHLLPHLDSILHHFFQETSLTKPGDKTLLKICRSWNDIIILIYVLVRSSDATFRSTVSTKTDQVEISLQTVEKFFLDNQLVLTGGRIHLLLEVWDTSSVMRWRVTRFRVLTRNTLHLRWVPPAPSGPGPARSTILSARILPTATSGHFVSKAFTMSNSPLVRAVSSSLSGFGSSNVFLTRASVQSFSVIPSPTRALILLTVWAALTQQAATIPGNIHSQNLTVPAQPRLTQSGRQLLSAGEDTLGLVALLNQRLHDEVESPERDGSLLVKWSLDSRNILQVSLQLAFNIENDDLLLGKLGDAGSQRWSSPVHMTTRDSLEVWHVHHRIVRLGLWLTRCQLVTMKWPHGEKANCWESFLLYSIESCTLSKVYNDQMPVSVSTFKSIELQPAYWLLTNTTACQHIARTQQSLVLVVFRECWEYKQETFDKWTHYDKCMSTSKQSVRSEKRWFYF